MPRGRTALILTAILLVTGAIFAPSLANGFAMDDRLIAKGELDDGTRNPLVAELRPLSEYFSTHYWHASRQQAGDLFRPVTILSYALVRAAAVPNHAPEQREAFPQHLLNVLLHLLATALVYRLARAFIRPPAALAAALVFGLHAIKSEVVASIVGRAELLAFVGGAAALSVLDGNRRVWLRRGCAMIIFFVAYGSKESALAWAPFVAAFGLARRLDGAPIRWRRIRDDALCALAPAALFLVLRERALGSVPTPDTLVYAVNPLWSLDAPDRILNAIRVWGFGLLLTLVPFRLAADYSYPSFELIESAADPGFLIALLALTSVLAAGLWNVRRRPVVFAAAGAFLGFSFLTSNVPIAIGTVFGERLYYAPSLGLALAAGWAATAVANRPEAVRTAALVGGAWCVACAFTVLVRNRVWNDDRTLFLREVVVQPDSVRMQMCAANVLSDEGRFGEALAHLHRAVELEPEYALAWNNLSATYLGLGRWREAEYCVERGLLAEHVVADDRFKLHTNLGFVLGLTGREPEAIAELTEAVRLEPGFHRARFDLLNLLFGFGSVSEFERVLSGGLQQAPDLEAWPVYRGLLAYRRGQWTQAVASLEEALARPSWPQRVNRDLARLVRAESLARLGRAEFSVELFTDLVDDEAVALTFRARAAQLRGQWLAWLSGTASQGG